MAKAPSRLYYISDTAYAYLTQLAVRQGYKKNTTERAVGMSEFLDDLAYRKFTDTRPPNVRSRHDEEIKHNRAPIWLSYVTRRQRMLYLPRPAIARYMHLAEEVGITREEPYIVGGPSVTRPISVVGYVLEGIGLKWITPESWPMKRTALE